jgi:hypothetical protein
VENEKERRFFAARNQFDGRSRRVVGFIRGMGGNLRRSERKEGSGDGGEGESKARQRKFHWVNLSKTAVPTADKASFKRLKTRR